MTPSTSEAILPHSYRLVTLLKFTDSFVTSTLPIRRQPGVLTNVLKWEHCAVDNQMFWHSHVYYSNNIIILILNDWFKNILSPKFCMKTANRIFLWYSVKWHNTCSYCSYKLSFISLLVSLVGDCTLRKIIAHQWPLSTTYTIYAILSLTSSTLLTAILFCGVQKNPIPNWWF